jgi:hypothetical protein
MFSHVVDFKLEVRTLSEFEVHTPLCMVPMRRMRGGRKKGGEADAE